MSFTNEGNRNAYEGSKSRIKYINRGKRVVSKPAGAVSFCILPVIYIGDQNLTRARANAIYGQLSDDFQVF